MVADEFNGLYLLMAGHVELTASVLADHGMEAHQVLNAPLDWTSDTIDPPFSQSQ